MKSNKTYKFSESKHEPEPRTLYIVGTPIGNLGDLSPRAKTILKHVSLIACEDTRRSGQLLKIFELKTPTISYYQHNIKNRLPKILNILENEGSVALISDAGLPGISDPGEELVHAAKLNNYAVICIPGPCAAITALVISGLPSKRFCFEGFLPSKQSDRKDILKRISKEERTTIIYESPHQITKLLVDLCETCGERRPLQIARELTKRYEETIGSTIKEAIEYFKNNNPRGEFTLVLGGNLKNEDKKLISESDAINKVKDLLRNGKKSKEATQIISIETGYSKKFLYAKLHSKIEK